MKLSVPELLQATADEIKNAKDYFSKKLRESTDEYMKICEGANKKLVKVGDVLVENLSRMSSAVADAAQSIKKSVTGGAQNGDDKKLSGTSSNRKYKEKKNPHPDGVKTKIIQTEKRIREEEGNFDSTSRQRHAAIKNRKDKDIIGELGKDDKLGETTEARVKRAEEELVSYKMDYKAIDVAGPDAKAKQDDVKEKMRVTSEKINALKKDLAVENSGGAGSSNVVMSSDFGQKLDDLKTMLDSELSDGNIKKSVDKILEELKNNYSSGDDKSSGTEDSAVTSDIGFGGDIEGDNLSTPPTTGIPSGSIVKSALEPARNRLALDPGLARSTINLPATATTPQQSTNEVHQTLKKVKEIIERRLPGDYF